MKDFTLLKSGFIIEADDDIVNNFLKKRNLDKHRGSLVVHNLQFYKKRLICWANVF